MNRTIEEKRKREKRVVEEMIRLTCRKKHKTKHGLCESCEELLKYA